VTNREVGIFLLVMAMHPIYGIYNLLMSSLDSTTYGEDYFWMDDDEMCCLWDEGSEHMSMAGKFMLFSKGNKGKSPDLEIVE
jgi:hypothetical protein